MARFAAILDPPFASRHVVDETGLAGGFDFTLDFSREILDSDTNQPRLNPRGARYGKRGDAGDAEAAGAETGTEESADGDYGD